MTASLSVEMEQDHDITAVITSRVLSATPGRVFDAFEDPVQLAAWWGPDGFTNTFSTFEFRPGGNWIFLMHAPNGASFPNESIFLEIEQDRRIVIDHVVNPLFRLTVTLTPEGEGRTKLGWHQDFGNAELAAKMRQLSATANEQVLNRLEKVLADGR